MQEGFPFYLMIGIRYTTAAAMADDGTVAAAVI